MRFVEQLTPAQTFISVLTLGELRRGAALRARRGDSSVGPLGLWIDVLESAYTDCILPVNREIARLWGELSADRTRPIIDTLLAATALHHGLTLVTRNTREVQDTQVRLHNPWLEPPGGIPADQGRG